MSTLDYTRLNCASQGADKEATKMKYLQKAGPDWPMTLTMNYDTRKSVLLKTRLE